MDLTRVKGILSQQNLTSALYFTVKSKSLYTSYSPEISPTIMESLICYANEYLDKYMDDEQIDFNPTGYRDGTIEITDFEYVGNYNEVIQTFDNGAIECPGDLDFSFYCLDIISEDGDNVKLFRRVTKFKKLYSKGLLAAFQGNRLNKVEDKMIGLDGDIDIVAFENEIAILNHISLERIFRLEDQFSTKAHEAIEYLRNTNKVVNFEDFEEDCLNDLAVRKVLTKMLKEGNNLNICFDNFDNVLETIDIFGLEIEVQTVPSIGLVYEDKRQVMDILRLARDSYYRSLIQEKPGIDNRI